MVNMSEITMITGKDKQMPVEIPASQYVDLVTVKALKVWDTGNRQEAMDGFLADMRKHSVTKRFYNSSEILERDLRNNLNDRSEFERVMRKCDLWSF
jgi:hypothetical protein